MATPVRRNLTRLWTAQTNWNSLRADHAAQREVAKATPLDLTPST
jgi:hypothetical protein